MNSSLWKYSLRQNRRRLSRSLLTLMGIVIGVATMVATSIATQTMRGAYRDMFDSLVGRASLEILADGRASFDAELERRIESLPEVKAAVGVVQTPAVLLTDGGKPWPLMILAVDPARDTMVRDYDLASGQPLDDSAGVLINQDLADNHQLTVGQRVRLFSSGGLRTFPIAGVLKSTGAARFNGGRIVFMSLSESRRWLGGPGQVNGIHVVLAEGVTADRAEARIAASLPTGLTCHTNSQGAEIARNAFQTLEQILAVLGMISLLAGAFVIINTIQLNLGERRRHLAILRAVGATPRQITRMLLKEAFSFGVVGTVLGIGLGIMIATILLPGLAAAVGTEIVRLSLTAEPFLIAIVLGPGVAVLAAYGPARRASKRQVINDLQGKRIDPADRSGWLKPALGVLLSLVGIGVNLIFPAGWLPPTMGRVLLPLAATLLFSGLLLLLPQLLHPLVEAASWIVARLFGAEGRWAGRQLQRHRSRTILTCGVLLVAIGVTVGPGNSITSANAHLAKWLRKVAASDYFVSGAATDLGFITAVSLPDGYADEIETWPGVKRVDRANWFPIQIGSTTALLIANTYDQALPERLTPSRSSPEDLVARLQNGEAAVGTVLANRLGLQIGDEIEVKTTRRNAKLRVAGFSSQYHAGGMTVHLHRDVARELFDIRGDHLLSIDAENGANGLEVRLREFCRRRGLLLQSFSQLKQDLDDRMASVNGFLWVMMFLIFFVAALAVVNTLSMNVIEQTRELAMLRAIGMYRRQVARAIAAQATGMVITSLLPGLLLGLGMALLMNLTQESLTGHHVPFQVHWNLPLLAVLVATTASLLAAWLPALRAARLSIIRGLQHE